MKPFSTHLRACGPIVLMLVSAPFVIWGALSVSSNTADITQWLPDGNDEKQQYARFVETFGADNSVLVSWPGCTLEDERIDDFADRLEQQANGRAAHDLLIRRMFTARQVLQQLMAEPLRLSRDVAIRRMQGTLIGPDAATGSVLIQLASSARSDQHAMIDMIYDVAPRCGVTPDAVRVGGTAYTAVMIERESERSLRRYSVPSCLVALVVAWCCLRDFRLTTIILAGSVFSGVLSLAIVYYTGGQLNAVMIVMPPLVFVLTVSGSVHLIHYYRDAVWEADVACAARRAVELGWLPCTLAALTSALGLMSLAVSAIAPVRMFGLYSGLALLASLVVLLTYLPAALRIWPSRKTFRESQSIPADRHVLAQRRARRVGTWLCRYQGVLTLASLMVFILLGAGLVRVTTSVELERSFRQTSRFVRDYRWIEKHIGPLISVETLVRFKPSCQLSMLERMELMDSLHFRISRSVNGGVLSPATFSPVIPRSGSLRGTVERAVVGRKLSDERAAFVDRGLIAEDGGDEVWRLSVRAPAVGDLDYGLFVQQLRQPVQTVMDDYREAAADIDVSYTGFSPLIDKAQQQLLSDLASSFLLACLLICPIMMMVLRSFWGGLLAMVPNVFPIVCIFGALGWMGISIDIGSMLTASIALGIAVDNTLHFLTWYSRSLREGFSRMGAVRNAYQRCSAAMIQTTLICGLGMLVFAFSSYTPASRFAWMIALLLLAALGGSLVLLPAIVAGPLGRAFESRPWRLGRDDRQHLADAA
jgi:uncharacterized protein